MEILDTLPAYAPMKVAPNGLVEKDPNGLPVWSNETPPPAIDELINIRVNGIGQAVVKGYFIEAGYLGLYTLVREWPPLLAKQNEGNHECYVFGAEIGEKKA